MKKQLENFKAMHIAVFAVLMRYEDVWKPSVVFSELHNRLQSLMATIKVLIKKTESKNSGLSKLKNELKADLIASLMEMVAEMLLYFKQNNDTVNFHKVKYTKSDFGKMRISKLLTVSGELVEIARKNLESMLAYNITDEELIEIEAQIQKLEEISPSPRLSIVAGKTAREELSVLFSETNHLLSDEIDLSMQSYKKSHPDFYNDYFNARKVIQYGVRHDEDDNDDSENEDEKKDNN